MSFSEGWLNRLEWMIGKVPVVGTNGSMQWSMKESDGSGGQVESSLLAVQGDLEGMVSPSTSLKHELTMCVNYLCTSL